MTTPFDSLPVTRRLMLGGAGSVALAGLGIISFRPVTALAAANDKYPDDAFKQKDGNEAIKLLYGRTAEPSDKIKLDAPEIAENGAVVPVSVSTALADVTTITFVVPKIRTRLPPITRSRRARCQTLPIVSKWRKPATSS